MVRIVSLTIGHANPRCVRVYSIYYFHLRKPYITVALEVPHIVSTVRYRLSQYTRTRTVENPSAPNYRRRAPSIHAPTPRARSCARTHNRSSASPAWAAHHHGQVLLPAGTDVSLLLSCRLVLEARRTTTTLDPAISSA